MATRSETQRRTKIETVQMVLRPLPITLAEQSPPLHTPSKRSDCIETQMNVVDMREDIVGDREIVRHEEECQDGGKESDVDEEEAQGGKRDEEYGQESDVVGEGKVSVPEIRIVALYVNTYSPRPRNS